MKQIILVTEEGNRFRRLIECLESIFPECDIRIRPPKGGRQTPRGASGDDEPSFDE